MHTVVIIDDEPWTRDVIKSLGEWEKLGLEVVGEASDGETGWLLIRKVLPDIVITDVRMPRINGLDLVRMMREENMESPVVVISGYDDYDYVHKALKLGVVDYLLKPIKPEDLNKQLENCVNELNNHGRQTQSEIRAEFIPEDLERECRKIKEDLKLQLQLWKKTELEDTFEKLARVVTDKEGKKPPQSIQIGMYYEVLSILQKYVEQEGYSRDEVFDSLKDCFVFSRENTFQDMVSFFVELYFKTIDYVEGVSKKRNRIDTDVIIRYLKEHFTEGITLEETAEYFHVSKEYLSKIFKRDQNIGFSDYILKLRMERAAELIKGYNAPLKEVGFLTGYTDIAHFYKTFKKYYGITPGEMRAGLKNDNKLQ